MTRTVLVLLSWSHESSGMKDCQTVITQSSQGHDFGRSTGLGVGIEKEGLVEFHRKEDILEKLSRKQYS